MAASPPSPLLFSSIPEHDKAREEEEEATHVSNPPMPPYKHQPTPLHHNRVKKPTKLSNNAGVNETESFSVLCNKCRPSARDKIISIVPLDANDHHHHHHPSLTPNILRSLFLSLTRRTPRSSSAVSAAAREEEWKLAATELSRKLLHVTRKRDEALLEASRLKYSLSELERKFSRLESNATANSVAAGLETESFLRAVAESRSAVRHLSRSLTAQIRTGNAGPRVMDRLSTILQPYDVRFVGGQSLLFYLEALLNLVFYGEFESEERGAPLDPAARCAANRAACEAVRGLGWEDVLSKGTKHYSEGLSRFCDRRMSEVVGMLGWARAWPEVLLQSFFGAAKGVWVVQLMARTVHPHVPILRVGARARFDSGFMEDLAAGRVRRLVPATVRMMVVPGFYVYSGGTCGVVKCKVLCLYSGSNNSCSSMAVM